MESSYESILFVTRECHVYRIPPRVSAEGYRAAAWGDTGAPLWTGRMRVVERTQGAGEGEAESTAVVRLEDGGTGELFAEAGYKPTKANPDGGVEAVLDSSRYFVLTVVDQESGAKAYLGIGFPERSEAFDFNVALQDWAKRQSSPSTLPSSSIDAVAPSPHAPTRDFALKPGETLSIKIGGGSRRNDPATAGRLGLGGGAAAGKSMGGGFVLPPPPPPAPRGR